MLEASCATSAETLSLRQRLSVSVMVDELIEDGADLIPAIRADAYDGMELKVSKQGGLTGVRCQRDPCRAGELIVTVQKLVGSEIAFTAVLHAAHSTPGGMTRCALDTRAMVAGSTAGFVAPSFEGCARAPDGPGLGIEPNRDVLGVPVAA